MNAYQLGGQLIQARDDEHINAILADQQECIQIYNSSTRGLHAFNDFSKARYNDIHKHVRMHIKLMKEVKGDLDDLYSKIQQIKKVLVKEYPGEMAAASSKYSSLLAHEDDA